MSALAFAAWGSVDFEGMDRMQRRAYLNRVRKEISGHGLILHSGGQARAVNGRPAVPHYQVMNVDKKLLYTGGSFREACTEALKVVDPNANSNAA